MRRDIYDMFFLLRKLRVIENVPSRFKYLLNRLKGVPLYEA